MFRGEDGKRACTTWGDGTPDYFTLSHSHSTSWYYFPLVERVAIDRVDKSATDTISASIGEVITP
jgi:hypothetical protein